MQDKLHMDPMQFGSTDQLIPKNLKAKVESVTGDAKITSLSQQDPKMDKEGHRKIGLLQAVSLNTLMMFGTGPFITIPFCIASSSPPGPQALIGYAIAAIACVCDSFIWAELGALFPMSGGSYVYAQNCLGNKWGRYVSFLFLWQLLVTGPMEVASGFIAIAQYMAYVTQNFTYEHHAFMAFAFCCTCTILLYRDMTDVGTTAVVLWLGMCAAIAFTLVAGFTHWNWEYFEVPEIKNTPVLIWSLGNAARFGIYDFTGYYDVNFIGKEVKDPERTIPLAGVSTCIIVCIVYFLTYLSVMAFLPWDPAEGGYVALVQGEGNAAAYIMSTFCEKMIGRNFAIFFTFVVIYCIYGSCFSLMLGFAQIPYAASKAGMFLEMFGHEHPTKGFADYSLLFMGLFSCIFCFLDLGVVIEGMMTTNIVAMFLANSLSLVYHRWQHPDFDRPYEMPLYPLPVIIQVAMFSFIFLTSDNWIISGGTPLLELGLAFLFLGSLLFLLRSKKYNEWPFDSKHVRFDNCIMLERSTTYCSIDTEESSKKETDSSPESDEIAKAKKKLKGVAGMELQESGSLSIEEKAQSDVNDP
eukprot:TRINITY_DN18_c0_g1_i1.p1 TRINITY_DN18_c0_g1~~TRINITY_DN18_c0_g1_i1.p1  ORF type:complete len:580 (-),score=68.41 TRINITY_DN18_c0_g1_i1:522-2261(-)